MDASGIKCARVAKGVKVQRVTKVPRFKGQLRDRVSLMLKNSSQIELDS